MANKKKPLKKQKIRNSEYYDMQLALDELYAASVKGQRFCNLVELIKRPENIKLAYRNIRKNSGSRTAGVDNKTISDLNKWNENALVAHVQRKLDWLLSAELRYQRTTVKPAPLESLRLWTGSFSNVFCKY